MATRIREMASVWNGGSYVRAQYDDANNIVTRAIWANALNIAVRIRVIKPDGTTIMDDVIPAGTPEQSRNLPGNQRFNIEDEAEAPRVNLQMLGTPT